jgi:hypothetical protein
MNNQTIVCCVVALLLGMLLANMLKNVCGCKLTEGQGGNVACALGLLRQDSGLNMEDALVMCDPLTAGTTMRAKGFQHATATDVCNGPYNLEYYFSPSAVECRACMTDPARAGTTTDIEASWVACGGEPSQNNNR